MRRLNRLNKGISLMLVGSLLVALTACGGQKEEQNSEPVKDVKEETSSEPESTIGSRLALAYEAMDILVSSDVEHGFTSAAMAIMKDGELVYENYWGLTNSYDEEGNRLKEGKAVDRDTLYDLASNTKMYSVIYATQLLVSRGELDINTKIVDILGDSFTEDVIAVQYKRGKASTVAKQKEWKSSITIKDVLCHQAGLPESLHFYDPEFSVSSLTHVDGAVNKLYLGSDGTREDTLELLCKTPLLHEPGGEPQYSDLDYMLMSFVLEKVTGIPLDEFLKTSFWEPMGLSNITYKPLENGYSKENIAATELHGNTRDGAVSFEGVRNYTLQGEVHDESAYYSMKGVSGNAGLFASAVDLAKLCSLMLDGTYEGKEYFTQTVLDEFTTPISDEYDGWGIGWWTHGKSGAREGYFSQYASYNTIGHQGWTGTLTMIDRENDLILVLLTNKINTPVTDNKADTEMFDGKWYMTSLLSFAAPMIYGAMEADSDAGAVDAMTAMFDNRIQRCTDDIANVSGVNEEHPGQKAYDAMIEAKNTWLSKYGK